MNVIIVETNSENSTEELIELAHANDFEVVGQFMQNIKNINARYYIGSGKVMELKNFVLHHDAKIVIFNNELTPLQYRNLEDTLEVEVMDRTMLILSIFENRAHTYEAKLQVEMAKLKYMLPRLVEKDANYEQQTGGKVNTRGSGEKQRELDRRTINNRLANLKKELDIVEKNRSNQRKNRLKNNIPLVALVGYTNAGKSTLMNAFLDEYSSKDEKRVFEKDMLFATLDTSIRKIKLPDNKEFLLSDTVGFVSNLPHDLVKAFRSTLSEVKDADLLIIVSDISNPNCFDQLETTMATLEMLDVEETPTIFCFNKFDKVMDNDVLNIEIEANEENQVIISAKNRLNIAKLIKLIKKNIFNDYVKCQMFFDYQNYNVMSQVIDTSKVISKKEDDFGTILNIECSKKVFNKYQDFLHISSKN